ncbi:hypothetical protein CHRY9390_02135 [Chryseobacterium aquaeductus]|uniref:DUF8201 domain-containing protein n=1 Tax=Chryseobacterium aquaeductus TaxID=2675056 RepID=A0A9N8MGL9_9FLAO|nr:hypothetical protein [Chryseobacterium aquaeductus]CAA7331434.1 hypothetical protein CHRY9390_02135 [Chryseobacterium potabilaquae]CAD7810181.1 hypothetical protein CHRY9390_02135 [Chryseobacterium aquaeductus]
MLLTLFSSIILIPTLFGWGKFLENMFKTAIYDGISGKILFGIFGISIHWTIIAFFIPLNLYVEIPTILIGLVIFFKEKLYFKLYQFSKKNNFLLAISVIVILFCSSFYPYILDHFGYYLPSIQWLREFGLVKGISNLDLVLGQMSIWHIFQAGFSNFADPFLRINAVLLIVYLIYVTEKKTWIQLCFLPFLLLFSQSPSPDLPVIIFSLIILNEIISNNKNTSLLFAFSVFVFAIKPTMIWLPILAFLYSTFVVKSHFKTLISGIFILLLFCLKNIWTFGYPVFPVSIIDFGFSWKPDQDLLQSSSKYAILKTFDNQYSYEEIQKFSTSDYIRKWIFLDGIKSFIHILFVLSLLIFIIFTIIKKNKIVTFICISLIIKSILVLVFSAQYRFFMDVFFVIIFVMLFTYFTKKKSIIVYSFLSLIFISFITFPNVVAHFIPSYRMSFFMGKFEWKQLYKPSTYEYKKFHSFKTGNLKFNVSKKYPFNFDTPIPAISESFIFDYQQSGIFPQLIDEKDISKGFFSKKMTLKEEKEIKKITEKIRNSYKK